MGFGMSVLLVEPWRTTLVMRSLANRSLDQLNDEPREFPSALRQLRITIHPAYLRLCGAPHKRKGLDSLAALVVQALASDLYTGDIFIFRSKRSDRLKLLIWDGSGLCLVSKRLESGAFTWPPVRDGAVTLNATQLRLLFSGMDWTQVGGHAIPMVTK
jgi:transposase